MNHLQAHVNRLEDPKKPPPPPAKRTRKRGSFNQWFLWLVCAYADGQEGAREALIEWVEGQTREGHCVRAGAIETSSASHDQLNQAAAAVGLLFAEEREDSRLTELFRDWWWSEVVLCQACEVPGAAEKPWAKDLVTVWGPGWRALQDGKLIAWNPGRDNTYRLIQGYGVPTRKEKPKLYTTDRYNLAFRALNMLPVDALRALRPAPGWVPPLPFPFHARRGPDWFAAWFDALENKDVALSAGWNPVERGWVLTRTMIGGPFGGDPIDYPAVERSPK